MWRCSPRRSGARSSAESRLSYDAERAKVELVSDASAGPYAGVHRFAAVEFLARLVDHIPAKGEVRVRYYGACASRRRGWWRRRGVVLAGTGLEGAHDTEREAQPWPALRARRRRWAELLRMVFAVDVEVCPRCGGEMRIIAFVTEHAVVTRILAHLERRGVDARAGPTRRRGRRGPPRGVDDRGGGRLASQPWERCARRGRKKVVAGRSGGAYARGGAKGNSYPLLAGDIYILRLQAFVG